MSVAIVAPFPWQAIRHQANSHSHAAIILTDTRMTIEGKPHTARVSKQFRLAKNLIATFTSSNLYATTEALFRKSVDPTTRRIASVASWRDVRRLGRLLRDEHSEWGGISEVVASIFERNATSPKVFELMHPNYVPAVRTDIIGIGNRKVIDCFQRLLVERMNDTKRHTTINTPWAAGAALMDDLTQAIEATSEKDVALPVQVTIHTANSMAPLIAKIRRQDTGQWESLTIDDEGVVGLPSNPARVPRYAGGRLRARSILA